MAIKNHRAAVGEFWIKTTGSEDRAREMIRKYYNRVEKANEFFTSHTEGWKTDRGMFYIVFGPPDQITRTENDEIWTYEIDDPNVATQSYVFAKSESPFSDNDYVLERSAAYRESWEIAVDAWREGRVISPK
jgi:GWxTD domain-containing protein